MALLRTLSFPDGEFSAVAVGGVLSMHNGLELPLKYSPASRSVKHFGLILPRVECTLVNNDTDGIGTLDGTYIYCAIEVDSKSNEGEGLRSGPVLDSEGVEVTVVNGSVVVTIPQTSVNEECDEIWIYRTVEGGIWPTLARIATVALGTATYTDSGDTPDFDNYPLDTLRYPYPVKAYNFKLHRRLIGWGTEELETYLTFTVGETTATYSSGDPLDAGCIGMVVYPEDDDRGYLITDFQEGSPANVTLKDAYAGPETSPDSLTQKCKLCRPSGQLRWSEPADYQNAPLANVRYVDKSGGDPESGAAAINGRGLLFTVAKTYLLQTHPIYGPRLTYGNVIELSNAIGCLSHRTIQECAGFLLWLDEEGIAMSMGGAPRIISDDIAPEFEDMKRETTGRAREAFAINWRAKQRYICFIPKTSDSVGCSRAIVCQYNRVPGEPQFRFTTYDFDIEFTCAALERHTVIDEDGNTNYQEYPILGDENGYVWSFGAGDADGVESGTIEGTIDAVSTSPSTLTDEDATFNTSGLGLAGVVVTIRRASDGAEQRHLVTSNSGDTLSLASDWDWLPAEGDAYWVGGIAAHYETGASSLGSETRSKSVERVVTAFARESAGEVTFEAFKDFSATAIDLTNEGDTLDLTEETGRDFRPLSKAKGFHFKFRWGNKRPDQPFTLRAAAALLELEEP